MGEVKTHTQAPRYRKIIEKDRISVDLPLKLKRADASYFKCGKVPHWDSIYYLQRRDNPEAFEGPYLLRDADLNGFSTQLTLGRVWVKDNSYV